MSPARMRTLPVTLQIKKEKQNPFAQGQDTRTEAEKCNHPGLHSQGAEFGDVREERGKTSRNDTTTRKQGVTPRYTLEVQCAIHCTTEPPPLDIH